MRSRAIRRKWASAITSIFTLAFLVGVTGPAAALAPTIVLDPATDTNAVGTEHTVTATVEDEGTPIEGASVHFDVDAVGAPVPTSGDDVTDAAGQATFTFTNTEAVTNTITACIEIVVDQTCGVGETSTTATKTWEDPAPTTISLAPLTDTNPVGTDHTVTATVEDQFGEPFEGADVHFDVDAVGAPVPSSGDDVTDAAGEGTFTFTNTEAVTNSITGCIDANANQMCDIGEVTVSVAKVWEVRVATTISLAPPTATNVVNTDHTVTATVVDQFGDPVQGVAVLFDVSSEGTPSPTSGSGLTNASGLVTFTFTNSTGGVTNTVTACMDTAPQNAVCDVGEETDTATKAWEAEEPPETCPGFEADPRNQIVGTPGDDVLEGTPGDDIICGLGGNDTMAGLGGDDLILGGPGDDTANGGAGEDVLIGGGGADTLAGGPGDDILRGNAGRDVLRGGVGFDLLIGGGNRDILQGGGDDDILRGNAGNDVLRGGGGDDDLRGGGGRDAIRGASGDDTLRGGGGNDDLRAGGGDDRVFGGSGDDVLRGGSGNDLLNGGAGTDSCAGGPGSDVLVNCES